MIGLVEGFLVDREIRRDGTAAVLVSVNGLGYELMINVRHFHALPPLNSPVAMRVHTHMREGSLSLYGFVDRDERMVFDLLLSAHGVGPAMALAILGAMPIKDLIAAVHAGDIKSLTAIPGVGTKTAQRLVLELAEKMESVLPEFVGDGAHAADRSGIRSEVSEALAALGYGTSEIRAVLREIPDSGSVDELLRASLLQLAPSR